MTLHLDWLEKGKLHSTVASENGYLSSSITKADCQELTHELFRLCSLVTLLAAT